MRQTQSPARLEPSRPCLYPGAAEQPWLPMGAPGAIPQGKKKSSLSLSIVLRNALISRFAEMYAQREREVERQ